MTESTALSRRRFLASGLAGCCAAAAPVWTPITFASAPSDKRLVVIVLRGAMDGLDVVRPIGDRDYQAARAKLLGNDTGPALGNFFALHPGLADLMPLWKEGSLGFVHAVSTPYRDKRSHFEGQDVLEAGLPALDGVGKPESGWMNRLAGLMPGAEARTAFSVGREGELILKGPAPATSWYPDTSLSLTSQGERLMRLIYEEDPLLYQVADQAFGLLNEARSDDGERQVPAHRKVADYVGDQLLGDTRLAAFSLSGWDTHGQQEQALKRPLTALSDTLLTLRQRLDPVWDRTAILAMTEFGRSVRANGTGGTDHGTGGAMLMAGGALKGGKVYGDWPGLAEADLYQRRDLMPTADVRSYAAQIIRAFYGVEASALEAKVFPGLDLNGAVPKVLL